MDNDVINELNGFLKGNFMAIHSYEKYISNIDDEAVKQTLQKIQQNHKQHALMIAERIQNLGGTPVDNAGIMGNTMELINSIKSPTKGTNSILKDAIAGEQRGIEKSQQILDGDLDSESLSIVKHILNIDKNHVDIMSNMLH